MTNDELELAKTLVRCIRVAFRAIPPIDVPARVDTARRMLEVFSDQMGLEKNTVVAWAKGLDEHAFGYWAEISDEVIQAFAGARC